METVDVEVWVLVDSSGDYVASDDADLLHERYEERVQEATAAEGLRRVKITVKVPLPKPIECYAAWEMSAAADLAPMRWLWYAVAAGQAGVALFGGFAALGLVVGDWSGADEGDEGGEASGERGPHQSTRRPRHRNRRTRRG